MRILAELARGSSSVVAYGLLGGGLFVAALKWFLKGTTWVRSEATERDQLTSCCRARPRAVVRHRVADQRRT